MYLRKSSHTCESIELTRFNTIIPFSTIHSSKILPRISFSLLRLPPLLNHKGETASIPNTTHFPLAYRRTLSMYTRYSSTYDVVFVPAVRTWKQQTTRQSPQLHTPYLFVHTFTHIASIEASFTTTGALKGAR